MFSGLRHVVKGPNGKQRAGGAYVVEVCVMLLWLLVLLMAKVEELLLWLESKSRSQRHWDDLR